MRMLVLLEGKKLLKQEQSEGAEGEQGVSSYVTLMPRLTVLDLKLS